MKYFLIALFFFLLIPSTSALAATLPGTTSGTAPSFVSLSDIPAFNNVVDSSTGQVDLSKVLNSIYGLCIGLAAVLAVIQLMYAGFLYMGGDSITEKKVARQKITVALLGLLLVLSPAIVFGIIDKRILSLCIDVSALGGGTSSCASASTTATNSGSTAGTGAPISAKDVHSATWDSTASNASTLCKDLGGTPSDLGNGTTHCTGAVTDNCPVIGAGSTSLTPDQEGCCPVSWACSLQKQTRGQTSCVCSVDPDSVDPATLPSAATTSDKIVSTGSSGTSWKYAGSNVPESCPASIVDGVNLTESNIASPDGTHELSLVEKEQCCVNLLPINSCVVKNSFSMSSGGDAGEVCGCQ